MDTQTLILGGGPAGSAAATTLARAGQSVTLIDRDTTPKHKVCGEFLSAEALHILDRLGIDLQETQYPEPAIETWLGEAQRTPSKPTSPGHPIHTVRLASRNHLTEAKLPFPAQSFTRRCLDTLLQDAARKAGAIVLQASVEHLTPTPGGWGATTHTGQTLTSRHVILATGKHDLRGLPRPQGRQNNLVALKMYWQLTREQAAILQNTVELHLFPHGYAGLQLVEDGAANFTALIQKHSLSQLGGWPGLLVHLQGTNPHTAERLQSARPLLEKPLALSSIPYGFVRCHALSPTLYAIGDQAVVIPSFTGDGMSIALYTGIAAAQAILAKQPATLFQPRIHRQLRLQIARATLLSQALLHPAAKPLLTTAAHLFPVTLRQVASLTRLPGAASRSLAFPKARTARESRKSHAGVT